MTAVWKMRSLHRREKMRFERSNAYTYAGERVPAKRGHTGYLSPFSLHFFACFFQTSLFDASARARPLSSTTRGKEKGPFMKLLLKGAKKSPSPTFFSSWVKRQDETFKTKKCPTRA